MSDKKTCYGCVYKGQVPGSAHIRCKFDWRNSEVSPPPADRHGIRSGWYNFPLNYDPVWQEEECGAYSEEIDPKMVKEKYHPLLEIASMLR